MPNAIRIHQTGGPEVMQLEQVDVAAPAPDEARIRQHVIGLNYIDIYYRTGLYPTPLPSGLGLEGAGVVEAVGAEVKDIQVGDRVAYAGGALGAYADERCIKADRLVKLPGAISFEQAGAMMLQGLTAQYLLRRTYRVQAGDTILIHAAAGGVGLLVCQWAKALGATVIGTVSSDAKAEVAHAHGCDHTIIYTRENFAERVQQLTQGERVHVVYDSIGKDTFKVSLECLRPLGTMVSFGNASGAVEPFDIYALSAKSLFLTRPTVRTYTAKREDLLAMAQELFEVVENGTVKIEIGQRYALRDVAVAHRELEARKTVGAGVLLP